MTRPNARTQYSQHCHQGPPSYPPERRAIASRQQQRTAAGGFQQEMTRGDRGPRMPQSVPHPQPLTATADLPRSMPGQTVRPGQPVPKRLVRRKRVSRRARSRRMLWAGGGIGSLALAVLAIAPQSVRDNAAADKGVYCQERIQEQSVLSRSELADFLEIADRAPKADVRSTIDEPFCLLNAVKGADGTPEEREAYPLEFNPQTWFIVRYEDDEYVGFDFSFYREP